jgi:hypothetical protein
MTRLRGLATRPDGGVDVLAPDSLCLDHLKHGGGISTDLRGRRDMALWLMREWGASTEQLNLWVEKGVPLHLARSWEAHKLLRSPTWRVDTPPGQRFGLAWRWVTALANGGLTERQAAELIVRVCVCDHARHVEIVDAADIPLDRANRNKWRRSENGGPIIVN